MKLFKKIGFLICTCLALQASAQEGEFHLGFQVSPGLSWISTNKAEVSKVGSNLTLSMTALGEVGISDHWSLCTGIGLDFNRGGTLRHAVGGNFFPDSRLSDDAYNSGPKPLPDGTRLKYSIQYLTVPVGLKWRSGDVGPGRIYFEAPMISWSVAIQKRGSIYAGDINAEKENISKDVNPFHLSWGFGGGFEYPIGGEKVVFGGVRYSSGFNDITSNGAYTATDNPNENPFDPDDDFILHKENSHAFLHALTVQIGILF